MHVRLFAAALLVLSAASCHARRGATDSGAAVPDGPVRHVILVSVDGMPPDAYLRPDTHGLAVPFLREMARDGARSPGARTVYPAVTYPAHTTMVTGREPSRHGIHSNTGFDPVSPGGARRYAEDLHDERTIWDAARERGYATALVNWPVTVGARASFVLPELYPPLSGSDQARMERALTTPGILDAAERRFLGVTRRLENPETRDEALIDVTVSLILEKKPALTLLHLLDVDSSSHIAGPWQPLSKAAIEATDKRLARLVTACRDAGIWEHTVLAVVSDHGFVRVEKRTRPLVRFPAAGLIDVDPATREIRNWKAAFWGAGGQGYVYLRDPKDTEARDAALALFRELAAKPAETGIARVLLPEEIRERGGDPAAALSVETADGFAFGIALGGDLVVPSEYKGHHGLDPANPAMNTSMLFYGPPVGAGELAGARLLDLAPTIAGWLDLELEASGKPLSVPSPARASR